MLDDDGRRGRHGRGRRGAHRARGPRGPRPPGGREGACSTARTRRTARVDAHAEAAQEAAPPRRRAPRAGSRGARRRCPRARRGREAGRGAAAAADASACCIEDPEHAGARRRRVPLVLLRGDPAVVEHAPLARRTCARSRRSSLVKLRNVYSFFTIYANIDGFRPREGNPDSTEAPWRAIRKSSGWREPPSARCSTGGSSPSCSSPCATSPRALDAYQRVRRGPAAGGAGRRALQLVRAPQPRALLGDRALEQDKRDAYFTLYEALTTHRRAGRALHALLRRGDVAATWCASPWPTTQPESVHLCALPGAGRAPHRRGARRGDGRGARAGVAGPQGAHGQPAQGAPAALARGRRAVAPRARRSAGAARARSSPRS